MSTEKENSISYEKVDENLTLFHEIWFKEGYIEKYRLNEGVVFNSPFEMIDYLKENGNEDAKASVDIFEHTILDEPLGDTYLYDLKEKDWQRAEKIIEERKEHGDTKFWNSGVPKEILNLHSKGIKERYERIEKNLESYNDIWFGKGYKEKYKVTKEVTVRNPFEMIEYIRENGTKEEIYAVNIFAKSFSKNSKGYEYLNKLNKEQYSKFVNENSKIDIPNEGEGINHLSKYSFREPQKGTQEESFDKKILKYHFENIVENINRYHEIWFSNGVINKYRFEGKKTFNTPFEMIDYIKRIGNDEQKYAIDIFERTLLENPVGYEYVSKLAKSNVDRYEETLSKISKENFWNTKKGSEVLSMYAFHENNRIDSHVSMDLVKYMLDQYLETAKSVSGSMVVEEKLGPLRTTLNRYFSNYIYSHLGFWSKEENVYALHRFEQEGQSLPIETIEKTHRELTGLEVEDCLEENEIKEYQYEKFSELLNLFRTPGFIGSNYSKFKESFINQLYKPSIKNEIIDGSRKYSGIEILREIGKFAQDEDSRFYKISEEFMSNILFDKDLMYIVDTLRRYELNSKKSEDRIGFTYKEILERNLDNEKYLSWDWYKKEGSNILRKMYEYTPYMYMDVVKGYVDKYCSSNDLSDIQREDLRKILTVLFNVDMKSKNELLFKGYSDVKDSNEQDKQAGIVKFFFGEEDSKIRLEENLEFFKDTKEWVRYFKSNEFNKDLVRLFNDDNGLFNFVIDSLIKNSPTSKDSNYFDNLRMLNIVGKKLHEQNLGGAVTMEQYLEGTKEEIEKKIVMEAKRLCTKPHVGVTVNANFEDPKLIYKSFVEYLNKYHNLVDVERKLDFKQFSIKEKDNNLVIDFDIIPTDVRKKLEGLKLEYTIVGDDIIIGLGNMEYSKLIGKLGLELSKEISHAGNTCVINTIGIPTELKDSIKGLGLKYFIDDHRITLEIGEKEKFMNRIVGLLFSPTLHEWVEDDKINGNPGNGHLRSLFFVPDNLNIEYKVVKNRPFLRTSLTEDQRKNFYQNYLQWYLSAKHTTGDITSLNTVITAWLYNEPELKQDVYNQIGKMTENTEKIWKDLSIALAVTFDYERFKKADILKKLLLAVNIEQLTPLVTQDRFQSSLLASSILKSSLDIAKEESIFKGIMKTSATLRNTFDGTTSLTYLAAEQKERVERSLKKLGFSETDDGLQMFRNMWVNFWYLRGFRGESQTLKVTSAGIEISNPNRTMYETEKRKSETDKLRRKYDGGQDQIIMSWSQIRDVKEVRIDLTPAKDIAIKFLSRIASFKSDDYRPELVTKIQEEGPGNIILRLPGRDEPLCEIFAVHKPREFWNLLQDFSKLMVDEEASEDALELLKTLEKN